jgi:hypothetical protein
VQHQDTKASLPPEQRRVRIFPWQGGSSRREEALTLRCFIMCCDVLDMPGCVIEPRSPRELAVQRDTARRRRPRAAGRAHFCAFFTAAGLVQQTEYIEQYIFT